eukprot:g1199.t1
MTFGLAMTFGLWPKIRNNEDAMMELYHDEEGNRGWMVEYDGIDNREEWKDKARAAQRKWRDDFGRPTHWLAWGAGGVSCCRYSSKGWAQVETGEKFRITRLGMRQFVVGSKNKFVCQRCGDILADEKALRHHVGSGFCRTDKNDEQLRQLRVGRYVEAKQKADARKKLIAPVALTVGDQEVRTVGAFRYLGTTVDNCGRTGCEVQRRTAMAAVVVRQLRSVWRDASLPGGLKAMLYSALVSSVALYNAEAWTIAAADWKVLRRKNIETEAAGFFRCCRFGDGEEETMSSAANAGLCASTTGKTSTGATTGENRFSDSEAAAGAGPDDPGTKSYVGTRSYGNFPLASSLEQLRAEAETQNWNMPLGDMVLWDYAMTSTTGREYRCSCSY